MMTRSLRTLLTDIVDYAGLFPPAKLAMKPAVENYARDRMGEHEWMLGRLVCPATRLTELSKEAAALMPGTFATSGYREHAGNAQPWQISALLDATSPETLGKDLDSIAAFNDRHSLEDAGLAVVDMVEVKVSDVNVVDAVIDELPEDVVPFFEFPVTTDCRGFITALADQQAGAKIRTGGVVGDAFPTIEEVAAFLHACASVDVPFKATAGLHHPVRSVQPLTYEQGSACHLMHGFLNLFVASAVLRATGSDPSVTAQILGEEDPSNFRFSEEVLGWKNHLVNVMDVARARESFSLSFGSCSFDEPIADLAKLKLA
jgi:hypothetical protein